MNTLLNIHFWKHNQILLRHVLGLMLLMLATMPLSAQRGMLRSPEGMTSSTITAMTMDKNGFVWVGTAYGLNCFDGFRFANYLSEEDYVTRGAATAHSKGSPGTLSDNTVTSLYTDRNGTLWVGTIHGLNRFVPELEQFVSVNFENHIRPHVKQITEDGSGHLCCATSGFGLWHVAADTAVRVSRDVPGSSDTFFQVVAFDQRGRFWKADQRGMVICMVGKDAPSSYMLAQNQVELGDVIAILPHTRDCVYIVCQYGLICYDEKEFRTLIDLRDNMEIQSALHLDDGRLILGTRSHGLWSYDEGDVDLQRMPCTVSRFDASTANISALMIDHSGNVWAGCYRAGLLLIPTVGLPFSTWSLSVEMGIGNSELTSMAQTDDNQLLLTLSGHGLFCLGDNEREAKPCAGLKNAQYVYRDLHDGFWVVTDDGISAFDPKTQRAHQVLALPNVNVNCMTSDHQGRLYISTYGIGMCQFDPKTGEKRQMDMYHPLGEDANNHLCNDWIKSLMTDTRGNVWCATASGVSCYDPEHDSFTTCGWSTLLDDQLCQCIVECQNGDVLIGTHQGVMRYDVLTQQVSPATYVGLSKMSRSVRGIVPMTDGSVWLSTSHGIWLYVPEKATVFSFAQFDGPENYEYSPGLMFRSPEGRIYVGRGDGFLCFHPDKMLSRDIHPAPLMLTSFHVDREKIKPGMLSGGKPVFTNEITKAHEFSLDYSDNSFSMAFSSLSSDLCAFPQMQYKVDNGPWTNAPDYECMISFSHMPSGSYRIGVRSVYQDQISTESYYTVTIRTPWYLSWWAIMLYVLLIVGFAGFSLQLWYRHKKTQVEEEKMKLLIDTTHDIRTPLTLILSPLYQLCERHKNDAESMRRLQIIDTQTQHLLSLVNMILGKSNDDLPQPTVQPQPQPETPQPVRQPSRGQRVLLVDDEKEMTDYISTELAGRYRCYVCHSGLTALQMLLADPLRYDVVVSDVLMPEMDGMSLLRSIKSNSQISHVPVVLLSSNTEISHRLESLAAGADAYLSKPFVMDELRATIDSLIANNQRHRSRYGGTVEVVKAASESEIELPQGLVTESDSRLLERVVKAVNQHLSEAEFGVDELCSEVGISRSQLHRKMKELTGVGAGEFVRNIRLEQAARLLRETDLNVSQVAYAVSFSNMGHFSKIFRQHFGVYPSEYGTENLAEGAVAEPLDDEASASSADTPAAD